MIFGHSLSPATSNRHNPCYFNPGQPPCGALAGALKKGRAWTYVLCLDWYANLGVRDACEETRQNAQDRRKEFNENMRHPATHK